MRSNAGGGVVQILFYIYWGTVWFANALNEILAIPAGLSITYVALFPLIIAGVGRIAVHRSVPTRVLPGVVIGLVLSVIALRHSLSMAGSHSLKLVLYYSSPIMVGLGVGRVDRRPLVVLTLMVGLVFTTVGLVQWYREALHGDATSLTFAHVMVFEKQDYTILYTVMLGVLLGETHATFRERAVKKRWWVLGLMAGMITVGAVVFQLKTLFIVVPATILALVALRIFSPRVAWTVGSLGVVLLTSVWATGGFDSWLMPAGLRPLARYVTGSALPTEEAKHLDTLLVREAIAARNVNALASDLSSILVGVGSNVAQDSVFVSELSGRRYTLPSAFESGLLWSLTMSGILGLVGFLLFVGIPVVRIAVLNRRGEIRDVWIHLAAIMVALMASNIVQDNIGSLLFVVSGIAWVSVPRARNAVRRSTVGQ